MEFCNKYILFTLCFSLFLSGCSTTDSAVFVTKTTIAVIDVDSTPGTVSFAYDRVEGFFGPNYENGAVPPVVASMKTSGEITSPTIKQLYATGEAATLVINPDAIGYQQSSDDELVGGRKALIFGTSTSLGFKFGLSNSIPNFTLGYKRKEASYIPIHKGTDGNSDKYSSVLASIDTTITTDIDGNEFENGQYFATGEAAKLLAVQPYIKDAFKNSAESALGSYDENFSKQVENHSGIIRCAFNLSEEQWKSVIDNGIAANLFSDLDDTLVSSLKQFSASKSADDLLKLMKLYSEAIAGGIDPTNDHSLLLKTHENLVCNLAGS
ncbi:MAG: hypothetical protein V7780_14225 [Colwellia sp.]|jgi:hypothetical protein